MKVLFVGEGTNDIGASTFAPQPRSASGVLPTLSRKLSASISQDSVALSWTEIPRLIPAKKGYEHKLAAARFLAARYGCEGLIAVVDRDRDDARLQDLNAGRKHVRDQETVPYPVAVGVAVESIESWTLGDPNAVAASLNVPVEVVKAYYNAAKIEGFSEQSGNANSRPKRILERITEGTASRIHQKDSTDFRCDVAERTNLQTLKRNCPQGFAPFAEEVRRNFP